MNTESPTATQVTPAYVDVTHPESALELSGRITFRAPDLFVQLAIDARMLELANLGRAPEAPTVLLPELAPITSYRVQLLATLEFVVSSAPKGYYTKGTTNPELNLGALDPFEMDFAEGVLATAYNAYLKWRESFRQRRSGAVPETANPSGGEVDSRGGAQGGTGPA